MKILLINPPAHHELVGNNPPVVEQTRGTNPPLGLLCVAACVEAETRHNVSVVDAQVENADYAALREIVAREAPDVVGVSAMTLTLIDALATCSLVKEVNPDTVVVLGGPHAFLYPDETISQPTVDFLVVGEGERTFPALVERIGDAKALRTVPGLVFEHDGCIVHTGTPELIENLDALPFPARRLTPVEKYGSVLAARKGPVTTMITSRGCPYGCSFCARPHLGKKFRKRSARNVVDEMLECVKMGIEEFLIYDDTFTVDRERVMSICREITARKLDIAYDIRARVDCVDEEMLGLLRRSGCRQIHYGVESGTPEVLSRLNKGITLEHVRHAFSITRKAGMGTLAYFMIGCPGETREDILRTIAFAKELRADYAHFTILTPFPASRIYRDAIERGVIAGDVWRHFAAVPDAGFQPPYWEEKLSRDELVDLLDRAYRDFYGRPRYILGQIARVRSLSEFARKAGAGLRLLSER